MSFSKAEKENWAAGKQTKRQPFTTMDDQTELQFLEMVARLASPIDFKRQLDFDSREVEHHKKTLNIENQEDARRLAKKLSKKLQAEREAAEADVDRHVVDGDAQARLEAHEAEIARRETVRVDQAKIAQEYAEASQRHRELNEPFKGVESDWRLPLNGTHDPDRIRLFRSELEHHGVTFCIDKYQTTRRDIIAEAKRLEIDLNWDDVKS